MRSEKRKRKTTAVFLLSCTLLCSVFPVQADEIIVGNDSALEEEDVPDDVADAAEEDASELFVDTGNDVVSRKGETLDEAMEEDSGMTVNTGHLYEINGVPVRNSDFPSELNECWAYANNLYAKIWGHNFQGYADDSENMLRNLPDEELTLTPEHLKAYVSAAPAGAALRICNEDYLHGNDIGGHSQIIISHDENGFTVFEGGLQTWPHRREAYYTWDGFCYGWPGKYHYIKYVKWPGAFPWERGMTVDHAQDPGALLKQVFRNLAQIVSDMIRGNVNRKELNRDNSICSPASLPPAVYSGRSVLHCHPGKSSEAYQPLLVAHPGSTQIKATINYGKDLSGWRLRYGRRASGAGSSSGSSPRWRNCRMRSRSSRNPCGTALPD